MHHHETQKARIIRVMRKHPDSEFRAKDFSNPWRWTWFVWYEAPTRIWDLCRLGIVKKVRMEWKFAVYALTEAGKSGAVPKSDAIIR